jgi:hypothetical protein
MVDSVVAGIFFCQFIPSRQIDGDEPRRLVKLLATAHRSREASTMVHVFCL